MDQDAADLLKWIATAFVDVPRPSAITKSVARALDDEWTISDERHGELYAQDHETRWQELSDEELVDYNDISFFLDAEGAIFYFPAFMSLELRSPGYMAAEAIAQISIGRFDILRLFNQGQLRCLIAFLTHYALRDGADEDSYAASAADYLTSRLG